MKILFLSLGRINNIEEQGIYTDLLRQFVENGHKIFVVSPRERRSGQPTELECVDGATFLWVRTGNITKANLVEKGISTLMIERLFTKEIERFLNNVKFDLILYSTPPVTFEKIIRFIKNRDGAKTYLLLKDIFPQNAVDLAMIDRRSLLYRHFRKKEKKLYQISDYIGCMSQANVDHLLKHNPELPEDLVEVCPNSLEPINTVPNPKEVREIRSRYEIPVDRTVFIYGGNLGKPQGVDFIVECLKSSSDNEQLFFVIVGSGTEFKKIKNYFERYKPPHAMLIRQLPKHYYELLVSACDVGLIFLDRRFTIPNFPSRILSYMQASIPVLAATDVNTDLGKVIEGGEFGFWCESNDTAAFNNKVKVLCDQKMREMMGANARRYLMENYTAKHSYEIIMRHFN